MYGCQQVLVSKNNDLINILTFLSLRIPQRSGAKARGSSQDGCIFILYTEALIGIGR
jgi:hypothetical protein